MANNQNDLYDKYSRYVAGGVSETANGFIEWWERSIFPSDSSDIVYTIENFYEGRMDLIASAFYDEPRFWWVIAQYNNILDPFGETTAGRVILIPTKDRLFQMLSSKKGGVPSTKQAVNTISPLVI
jgi:hypothetical protein